MEFEWNAATSALPSLALILHMRYGFFVDPRRMIRQDERKSYGEERYQLFGRINERLFVIVSTYRRTAIRIISARKANAREVRAYDDASGNN